MPERLIFQTEDDCEYTVKTQGIARMSFMDDGSIFMYYTAGDCDVFLPYVEI
jgi:uncharacterized protein (AIM24 family)